MLVLWIVKYSYERKKRVNFSVTKEPGAIFPSYFGFRGDEKMNKGFVHLPRSYTRIFFTQLTNIYEISTGNSTKSLHTSRGSHMNLQSIKNNRVFNLFNPLFTKAVSLGSQASCFHYETNESADLDRRNESTDISPSRRTNVLISAWIYRRHFSHGWPAIAMLRPRQLPMSKIGKESPLR